MPPSLVELCAEAFAAGLAPEPTLSVSAWADTYRFLSSVASAEPGQWRTSRAPYLAEIMDCLSPSHPAQRVVVMAGAQIGKTECGNNWIGYVIHRAPGPMLMVQPTVEVAKRVSKQRLAPMIEATPVLKGRVAESRSRDSGNTVQVKEFDGGVLIITGANSSAGLRSMPIRFLFMDEVDEYPGDVDGQGDPVAIAEKRTATFSRRKILLTSTPTIKGLSRIEREYLESDQRRYLLPCPHCAHLDYLTWRETGHHRIEWEEGHPETAHMVCSRCGERVTTSATESFLIDDVGGVIGSTEVQFILFVRENGRAALLECYSHEGEVKEGMTLTNLRYVYTQSPPDRDIEYLRGHWASTGKEWTLSDAVP